MSFISELHIWSVSQLSSSSSSSFHPSFTFIAVTQKSPWMGWGKALWRLRLSKLFAILAFSPCFPNPSHRHFPLLVNFGLPHPKEARLEPGKCIRQPKQFLGSWEGKTWGTLGAAPSCPGSELSTCLTVGAAPGWAGRHSSGTMCNSPECKGTTEVSHVDLEIKKGLLFKVGKQKDHILASAFPQVCRNEINFKKALEFSGNENNQMNIFADAKYSYRFSLGKFVLNLAKNMTIIYGKNRGCINYSDSKITKTSLKFLCKTSKMFLTTFWNKTTSLTFIWLLKGISFKSSMKWIPQSE